MSLYGLDIIDNGSKHLIEVNGINSGMSGFKQIYGDNRVQEKVYQMLQGKYGKLTVNDGSYLWNRFKKKHPARAFFKKISSNIKPKILYSPKAHTDWINEKTKRQDYVDFPFDVYKGQESTVLNSVNQILPHPLVNPYIAEELANNKFFQYLMLKNSEIQGCLPKTALVGLGFTDEKTLEELIERESEFIVKPILGNCGRGFKKISKQEAEKYRNSRGPVEKLSFFQVFAGIAGENENRYLEHYIEKNDFRFEPGLSIIQPFIDSRNGTDKYSVIRAIVCNGEFVDAYKRVSTEPRVNLAQGADAEPCNEDIAELCEKIVDVFEKQCSKYKPGTFKKELYSSYIESRGKTTELERKAHAMVPVISAITNMRF